MQPGDALEDLSSAKGWIHAVAGGASESGDGTRCQMGIGGGEPLS